MHAVIHSAIGLAALLCCGMPAWGQTELPAQQELLIQQRLQLLDSLLDSPALLELRRNGADSVQADLILAGRLRNEARSSLQAGNALAAEAAMDEARHQAYAAAAAGRCALPEVLRSRNADLAMQVRATRALIARAMQLPELDPNAGQPVQDARLVRLERMQEEATLRAADEQDGEASRILAAAYGMALVTLSELRPGEAALNEPGLNSVAEAYAYERRRNESHEMLLEILVQESQPEGDQRQLIYHYWAAHQQLHRHAAELAAIRDFQSAAKVMRNATEVLVRALRLTGMMIL